MTLPAPKAIIFDWDNTLVDTWPVIHKAVVETFTHMGMTAWTLQETKDNVRHSMRDAFPELFGDRWEEAGRIYQQAYLKEHLKALKPLRDATKVLDYIREAEILCFVVSNKKGPTLRKEITNLGWDKYFACAIGADDADHDKPHVDPVHMAINGTNITIDEQVWFIGDSDVDLECAKNCECTALLYGESAVDHVAYSLTHFHNVPFDKHIYDHSQLLDLLQDALSDAAQAKNTA